MLACALAVLRRRRAPGVVLSQRVGWYGPDYPQRCEKRSREVTTAALELAHLLGTTRLSSAALSLCGGLVSGSKTLAKIQTLLSHRRRT